jgi:hypothetical protein
MFFYDDDGDLKDKSITEVLRWFPAYGAYFLDKKIKRTAKAVTTQEFAAAVTDGSYDPDSQFDLQSREYDGAGNIVLISGQSIPPDPASIQSIPTGMYKTIVSNQLGIGLQPFKTDADDYIDLNIHTKTIQDDIDTFLSKKEDYTKMGLLHRRGLLLWGPPGTGKTRLVEYLCAKYADSVRVISVPPAFNTKLLWPLKDYLKDKTTFFIFEELTTIVDDPCTVSSFLDFMDGEGSWDNCLVLATTNYPEKLAANIVDRPSRFDRLYAVDLPDGDTRQIYLEAKLGKEKVTDQMVTATKGYSIAYLKELVLSVTLYGKDPATVIAEFEARKRQIKKEFQSSEKDVGF